MAKLTITFEDLPDGCAFISSDPSIGELVEMTNNPEEITTAQSLAMQCRLMLRQDGDLQPAGPAH